MPIGLEAGRLRGSRRIKTMDSMYLNGSEDVRRAGSAIQSAASDMQSAASNISSALERHQRSMDEFSNQAAALIETMDRLTSAMNRFADLTEKP